MKVSDDRIMEMIEDIIHAGGIFLFHDDCRSMAQAIRDGLRERGIFFGQAAPNARDED